MCARPGKASGRILVSPTSVMDYEELSARHSARYGELFGEYLEHLSWTREQIEQHQTGRLRALVTLARDKSAWHRARLAHVDAEALTRRRPRIVAGHDERRSDDQLGSDRHRSSPEPCPRRAPRAEHPERHLSLRRVSRRRSGGSSGVRGVFAWGWDAWAITMASAVRWSVGYTITHPETMTRPPVLALIAANAPTHMSSAMPQTFRTPGVTVHRLPVTTPMQQIVASLNDIQPTRLGGYAFRPLRARVRGRGRPAADRAVHRGARRRTPLDRDPRRSGAGLGRSRRQPLRNVGRMHDRKLLPDERRYASQRRRAADRTRRRRRAARRARRAVRQDLPDQPLQPDDAVDPLRDHRPGAGAHRAVSVRMRVHPHRRRAGPARSHVHLRRQRGHPPPRVSVATQPPSTSRRVPGSPNLAAARRSTYASTARSIRTG